MFETEPSDPLSRRRWLEWAGGMDGSMPRPRRLFISYATEDFLRAKSLARSFLIAGERVYFAPLCLTPGLLWERSIGRALREADVVVLLWTPAAKRSPWVEQEWRYVLELHERRRRLRPALRPYVEGQAALPPELSRFHFTDPIREGGREH